MATKKEAVKKSTKKISKKAVAKPKKKKVEELFKVECYTPFQTKVLTVVGKLLGIKGVPLNIMFVDKVDD